LSPFGEGLLGRTKREQDADSFRSERVVGFLRPGKVNIRQRQQVFAASVGGYLWRAHILLLTDAVGHTGGN
jgi:hypothetical protein